MTIKGTDLCTKKMPATGINEDSVSIFSTSDEVIGESSYSDCDDGHNRRHRCPEFAYNTDEDDEHDETKFDHVFSGWSVWLEPKITESLQDEMSYLQHACGGVEWCVCRVGSCRVDEGTWFYCLLLCLY